MIRLTSLLFLIMANAAPAFAQSEGGAVRTVSYQVDQVVRIELAQGFHFALELAPDDPVSQIAIGDPDLVQVSVAKEGGRVYLQAGQGSGVTNLTLTTASRRYLFDVTLTGAYAPAAYVLRFRYEPQRETAPTAPAAARYRLQGDRELSPAVISDDGVRTSIVWPPTTPLPAVFAVDDGGQERIVGGQMRGDAFVIDAVNSRLVFRIDDRALWAKRVPFKAAKQ